MKISIDIPDEHFLKTGGKQVADLLEQACRTVEIWSLANGARATVLRMVTKKEKAAAV